ncbi:MAG: DUF559 domain-containing protein [Tepidisphaeraceae bacterium]
MGEKPRGGIGRREAFKFRRQQAMNGYIVDFYCAAAKLAVELDGDSHSDRAAYDRLRTQKLNQCGLKLIRFENSDVFDHLDSVLESILECCLEKNPSP